MILGMYFCKYDMGEMASMIYNWDSDQVSSDHQQSDLGITSLLTLRWTLWW